ncbi:hypothetical protein HNQ59_001272 [Chitinivorax tropicus]|uniref:Uncharacterized protein n=1 Tax=Chitinivorax tropicus TaxID=714531 RepID=A0A840MM44_9PROT|nr:hypothetical protein [Chitinivorax tropicus]MBB5017987.1 hypothetical protein [Chitinivorax tropicus]
MRENTAASEIERLFGRLSKDGQDFLRERFKQIRKAARPDERDMLHFKVLCRAEIIQRASQFTFSRWCSGKAELETDDAQRLLQYLVTEGFWDEVRDQLEVARSPDQYFWSLVHELESVRTTRQKLRDASPGIYQVWRPSVVWPGRYVLGLLLIYFNQKTGAMRTLEIHRMGGSKHSDTNLVTTPEVTEVFRGYLVKKSSQLIVQSFERETRAFQITVFSNLLQQDRQIKAMSGLCLGLVGQRGLFCRSVALIRQAELDADWQHALDTQIDEDGWPLVPFFDTLKTSPLYQALDLVDEAQVPDFVRLRLAESAAFTQN